MVQMLRRSPGKDALFKALEPGIEAGIEELAIPVD
jgi:hypothetical protein